MKLLVFSDSHGETGPMLRAAREKRPDALAHLGDHTRDALALRRAFPELPLWSVRGNCDWDDRRTPESAQFELGGVSVFACHGHRYGVKTGLDALLNAGYFSGAKLVLFGHTHDALCERIGELLLLNPGSARRTYAEVEIEAGEIARAEIIEML